MKLYAICLVKNEDDIIAQTLTYATRYCDRVFVLDNGSTDETWHVVQRLGQQCSAVVPFGQTLERYADGLRGMVYEAVHCELSDDDWWLILDADEFLAEDPRPVIKTAVGEGAGIINTWQIQFAFTERDLAAWDRGKDRRDIPIFDRRRYYLINWQEPRLFRNRIQRHSGVRVKDFVPDCLRRVCSRRIFNRHYQFRDPEQIEKRLRVRYCCHPAFPEVQSVDWRSEIWDSRDLTFYRDGDPWHFSAAGLLYYYRHRVRARYSSACVRLRTLLPFTRDSG